MGPIASRWLAAGSTGTLGTVMLLLVLAPAGSAVAPHTTMTAPYTGSVVNSNSWAVSGCAQAKITTPATFSLSSGIGSFYGKASAKLCKGTFGGNTGSYGSAGGGSTVAVKIKVASTGAKLVVENWTFTMSGGQNITNAACSVGTASTYSYCDQYASASVSAFAWLVDLKTGSVYYSNGYFYKYNASYNFTYHYNGTYYTYASGVSPGGFSGTFGASLGINATLNMHHTYALYTAIYEAAYVSFATYNAHFVGGAHGSAWLDMASGSNGAVLNSVTVV